MFIYLAILNIMDGVFTTLGVFLGIIEEGNPMMARLLEKNLLLFLSFKCFLSLLLLMLSKYIKGSTSSILKVLSLSTSFVYTFILLLHLYWASIQLLYVG